MTRENHQVVEIKSFSGAGWRGAGKKGNQFLKVSEQKLLKTNVEKMSFLELPQKFMKTSQLKISSTYVDDNNET